MRKLKTLFFTIISLLATTILVACSQTKTTQLQMSGPQVSMPDSRITLHYRDDKLLTHTTSITLLYEPLGVKNSKEAKKYFESPLNRVKDLKGLTYKAEYKEDRVIQTIEIDLSRADLEEVANLIGLSPAIEGKSISYEKALQLYKELGFKEIDK